MENVISEIEFIPVKPKAGCMGFVGFVLYESLYCASVAVYSRPEGGIRLVWPKIDNRGIKYPTVYPINDAVSSMIENAVEVHVQKVLPV